MIDNAGVFRLTGHNRTSHTPQSVRQPSGRRSEWHVVATCFGHQFDAEREISAAGWTVYNPLHLQRTARHPDKIVALFPNYVFVCYHPDREWGPLRRVRYVWHVLMGAPGRPAVVPDGVVEGLQRRTSARRIVDDPLVAPSRFGRGQRLHINAGPLSGMEAVCQMSSGERVAVLFQLLGQEHEIEMSSQDVIAV